jgi:hypothetical protein
MKRDQSTCGRVCPVCGCRVPAGEDVWQTHVSGIQHRRRVAGQRAFGSSEEAYSIFEDTNRIRANSARPTPDTSSRNKPFRSIDLQVIAARLYGLDKPYHTALKQLQDQAALDRARRELGHRLDNEAQLSASSSQDAPSCKKARRAAAHAQHEGLPFDVMVALHALGADEAAVASTGVTPPSTRHVAHFTLARGAQMG